MRAVIIVLAVVALGGLVGPAHPVWAQAPVPSGTIITIAGNGNPTFAGDGGQATDASLNGPLGLAVGPDGTLYISDASNYRVRAVDPTTGVISTFAGNGSFPVDDGPHGDGGPATSATIDYPVSLAIDPERNTLYLPSSFLNRIRQVNLSNGIITNFAGTGLFDSYPDDWQDGDGGPATLAWFLNPQGVDIGPGNDVLIADGLLHRLRNIDGASGIVQRVAGIENDIGQPVTETAGDGGPAIEASFTYPYSLRVDSEGNVFVIDLPSNTGTIRRIDAATGIITRIAGGGANPPEGGGLATDVNFTSNLPDLALDDAGNLFIAHLNQVFKLTLATGELSTYAGTGVNGFAGDGGPAIDAQFSGIGGLAAVPGGGLLVADTLNHRVRYIAPGLAGDFNGDGVVDAGDYVRWRNHFGEADETNINGAGDGGGVTLSDYTWWKDRYGNPGSGGIAAAASLHNSVPEPSTLILAILASIVPGRRRYF